MDEQEGKRDIIGTLRKAIEVAQPNLRSYYRVVRKAKVVASYASDGQYYCDVQPLKNDETADENEPVIPAVAIPVMWGGPKRGIVCPPTVGTLCDLSYYDGDPNYPFISNLRWGMGQDAPRAELNELVIQLEDGVEIRIDKEKNIVTLTPENVKTENGKNWTVQCGENATIKAGKNASVEAGDTITIQAPKIVKMGNETTCGPNGEMGTVDERDHRNHEGSYNLQGPASISGDVTIGGNLTVGGMINGKVAGCSGC